MNNITIAILLNDIILVKIFEEISKNHGDEFKSKVVSIGDDISKYKIIITDTINLSKIKIDLLSNHHKIFCVGEKNSFINDSNTKSEISYLKVPFKFSELKSRTENLFSSIKLEKSKVKKFKFFNYENQSRLIHRKNKSLRLTEKENEIFNFLILHNDEYVSREKLLSEIWNYDKEIDTHTLETHMYSLRKKIDDKLQLKDLIIYKEKRGYVINSEFL